MSADASAPESRPLALITGGGRGIGASLSAGFARADYAVVLTAREAGRAEAAAQLTRAELGSASDAGPVAGIALDVTDPESVAELARRIPELESRLGARFAVLINNAGVVGESEGPLWEATPAEIVEVITTNVVGPLLTVNALAPLLIERGAGRIIDLNSGSGATGTSAYAPYSASKAALFRMADSVVDYGAELGLHIFELSPGVVQTAMTAAMPVHDTRTGSDWTDVADVVALALALASGALDQYSGRYVRAGEDTPATLERDSHLLTPETRRLVLGPRAEQAD